MTGMMTRRSPVPSGEDTKRSNAHPRFDRRRNDVEGQARRRRNRILIGVAVVVALVAISIGVVRSPLLDTDVIRVTGNGPVPAQQIIEASGLSTGDPLVDVDAADVRSRVMALPRIASARVIVEWPDTVRIAVTEELPLMLFTSGDGPTATWVTVSNHGRVIDRPTPEAAAGAVAAGAARVRVDDVSKLRLGSDLPTTLADVAIVFDQIPDTLRPEFVDATLTPEGTLSFALAAGGTVEFGPPEDIPAKLLAAQTGLGGRIERKCLDVLDVREPSRLTIKRRAGCTVPAPTSPTTTVPAATTTVPNPTPSTTAPRSTATTAPRSTATTAPRSTATTTP